MKRIASCFACLALLAGCYGAGKEPGDDPNRNDETPGEGRPADRSQQPMSPDSPTTLDRTPAPAEGTDGSRAAEPKTP